MVAAGIPAECPAVIAASKNPQFGDFQANGAMGAAKRLKTNPRELATKIIEHLNLEGIASNAEIAGPGFINITLDNAFIASQIHANLDTDEQAQTIVIDYSSPNLAKEMHVGHLRSTIIGDSLARVLEKLGHTVIRQNHMGDWGTQFGMLIAHLEEQLGDDDSPVELADLETFYREAKQRFDAEPAFADKARDYVVKLQGGDAHCKALWERFIDISISHSEEVYDALNVTLTRDDVYPESAYNDALPGVIANLQEQGLAVEDQGAQVVFLDELADKNGKPRAVIVQKSGGGFNYATTDLAAMTYRSQDLQADRVLYFIDFRQSQHMQEVFTIGRKAAFVRDETSLEHHAFGTMMGQDGKPFKTRAGGTVKLADLLVEAVERADKLVSEKSPHLSNDERAEVARKVGIGSVKYADLSKTRTNDYIFNWDSMLSFEGNTAPYLQYAYTRIQSMAAKANFEPADSISIEAPQERALGLKLSQFNEVVQQVAEDAYPHTLCNYLYELSSDFMSFYEHCPILKEGVDQQVAASRLALALVTAETLKTGLDLLGIETMERM